MYVTTHSCAGEVFVVLLKLLKFLFTQKSGTKYNVWSRSGEQGSAWKHAKVSISKQSASFNVEITGSVGSGYYSDMAIDDVRLDKGRCS